MELIELNGLVDGMLRGFMLNRMYTNLKVLKEKATIFVIESFGVVICCFKRDDYMEVNERVKTYHPGYRAIYITTGDNIEEKKFETLWELGRSGYLRFIRTNYPNQFKALLTFGNIDSKIINERLRVWGDKPKYRYLVNESKEALKGTLSFILTQDPGFFDYIPEFNEGEKQ